MSVSIAVIGAGHWGRNHVRNFSRLGALGAVCDSSADRLAAVAADCPEARTTSALDVVLADPSIAGVVIATPAATHGDLCRRALEAGKDVLVEKPICLDMEEARDLARRAAAAGRILMVGHLLHYHPAFQSLLELVRAGGVGTVRNIYSQRLSLGRIRMEENALWSFAPHDVAMILALTGQAAPEEVWAGGGTYLTEGVPDVTLSHLRFADGVTAHIHVSWLHPFKDQRLVVVGSESMAVFNDVRPGAEKLQLYRHRVTADQAGEESPTVVKADAEAIPYDETVEPLARECAHFLECIETRRTPVSDADEAIRVLSVLDRCQRSLEAREVVR